MFTKGRFQPCATEISKVLCPLVGAYDVLNAQHLFHRRTGGKCVQLSRECA